MSKELLEDLLIEFDEMGFDPTTLCDTKREIDSFRNRLKQVLDYFKSIDNANPSEALELVNELDNCLISDMSIEVDDYDESNYCMSYEYIDLNGEGLQFNDDIKEETIIDFIREKKISTIKQALLKAQEQEKVLSIIKEKEVDISYLKKRMSF